MGKIIAISNQKGGVGKTTTAVNLAAVLGSLGKNVLLVDIDTQGNATQGIGIDKRIVAETQTSIGDLMIAKNPIMKNYIYQTKFKNLSCIPGDKKIGDFEISYTGNAQKDLVLRNILQPLKETYDYIIVDCPPALSSITLGGLAASDSIIIPVQSEFYALEGIAQLIGTINLCKKYLNPSLSIEGILITMYQKNTNLSSDVVEELKKTFGNILFKTMIKRNVALAEAPSYGEPILYHRTHSPGSLDYIALAKEVISNE